METLNTCQNMKRKSGFMAFLAMRTQFNIYEWIIWLWCLFHVHSYQRIIICFWKTLHGQT